MPERPVQSGANDFSASHTARARSDAVASTTDLTSHAASLAPTQSSLLGQPFQGGRSLRPSSLAQHLHPQMVQQYQGSQDAENAQKLVNSTRIQGLPTGSSNALHENNVKAGQGASSQGTRPPSTGRFGSLIGDAGGSTERSAQPVGGPAYEQSPIISSEPNPNLITVSRRQQGNPVLKHIRNVRWQFGDIIPDYVAGQSTAVLFLSLRYHLLKPEYIFVRMKELGRSFRLRVLLVQVDTEDAAEPLSVVTRAAIGNHFTLICGFNAAECARYLEILKSYEKKPAETIKKDLGSDYASRATSALTAVRGVNKTDVKTLGDTFGSIAGIFRASEDQLRACPGIGPIKAKRLHEAFHHPFKKNLSETPSAAPSTLSPKETSADSRRYQSLEIHEQPEDPLAGTIDLISEYDEDGALFDDGSLMDA